jgi:hypothetical protein
MHDIVAINVGLDLSFDNIGLERRRRRKEEEINSTKAYVTNGET